jgi:hypothetical protein
MSRPEVTMNERRVWPSSQGLLAVTLERHGIIRLPLHLTKDDLLPQGLIRRTAYIVPRVSIGVHHYAPAL